MPNESRAVGRYLEFLTRHSRLVLLVGLLITALAGFRTAKTYAALKSDLEELLPESAPSVSALHTLRERLPGIRHLGVVISVDRAGGGADAARFIDALAERIRGYPKTLVAAVRTDLHAEREFGETYALQLMDPEDVRKLREAVESRRDWDVSHAMGSALDDDDEKRPELPMAELTKKYEARFGNVESNKQSDRFISADGRSMALLIQTASHGTGLSADSDLLERVKADVQALQFPQAYGGGLRVGYAGDVAARVEEAHGLEADLALSSAVVLLLVAGSVIWFYGSARALLVLGVPLLCGTVAAFGIVALPPWSIRSLNSNTAFLGSIVVGNGINSGIILLARFSEERRAGVPVALAIERAVGGTWKATLAASAAAAVAYGSLIFTNFRGFNQFGWIGGFGLMTCWLANYTLLVALLARFGGSIGVRRATKAANADAGPGFATRFVVRHPRLVALATAVLCLIATFGLVRRSGDWIEYDLSTLRRRDSWQNGERYWGKRMDAAIGHYLTPTVILSDSREEAEQIERRVEQMRVNGEAGGLIASVRSGSMFVSPERALALEEARRLKQVLTPRLLGELQPKDRELVERSLSPQALQPLDPAQIPSALTAGLREYGGRIDRNVLVFPKLGVATWNAEILARFAHDLRDAATVNGHERPVAGGLLLSSDIARVMKADGPRATWLSLTAVLAICWLAFAGHGARGLRRFVPDRESLGYSLLAMASLFVGVLLMAGTLAWAGERINFSNFVALPITFGIGADYSINLLRRYQSQAGGSLAKALSNTSGAVALCSATTVIGFGSLLMAQNRALFSFGVFAVAGELTCLTTAVIALPAALLLWERRERWGDAGTPGTTIAARR
jgi:predicted RND superfamily exporter protein